MSRRRSHGKRSISPDSRYGNILVSKFINYLMKDGKKTIAQTILYKSLDILNSKYSLDSLDSFLKSISNLRPDVKVKPVKVGGATHQVPFPVEESEGDLFSVKWLIEAAYARSGRSMSEKLAEEIFDSLNDRGGAIKKRDDNKKMAQANVAFASFAR